MTAETATDTCGEAHTGDTVFVTRWHWAVTEGLWQGQGIVCRRDQIKQKRSKEQWSLLENVKIVCRVFLVIVRASVSPVLSALFQNGAPR